ncbi:hypothetical protein AB0H36_46515 [Kribbella sp. NPDC050820]|uniref:hypothetical protein n=1 Tax=Kribbella sp. NPDC050820 TaxID=3155408 RepID=UPI0033D54BE5
MPGCARPALLGYFPEIFLTTAAQQADTRQQLTDFAAREGYVLQSIVFERLGAEPAAFERLVELARRDNVTTVVIPRSDDLDAGQRLRLAVEAGVHVVVAGARRPAEPAATAVNDA